MLKVKIGFKDLINSLLQKKLLSMIKEDNQEIVSIKKCSKTFDNLIENYKIYFIYLSVFIKNKKFL
jgi:hypothetical protein